MLRLGEKGIRVNLWRGLLWVVRPNLGYLKPKRMVLLEVPCTFGGCILIAHQISSKLCQVTGEDRYVGLVVNVS